MNQAQIAQAMAAPTTPGSGAGAGPGPAPQGQGQQGGSIWNMPGQIIGNLFGNRGNGNVVDMSGANVSIPPGSAPGAPGAPVGLPTNLNLAIRNNAVAVNAYPAPQAPASVGGKRKNRKGKKSRKGNRKHLKGGMEASKASKSGPAAAGAGAGAPPRGQGQPQQQALPQPRLVIAGVNAAQVQPRQPQGPPIQVMGNPQLRFAVQQ
jgi:hypothetical protein